MLQIVITIVVSPPTRDKFEDHDLRDLAFEAVTLAAAFLPAGYVVTNLTVCFAVKRDQPDNFLTVQFAFFKSPIRVINEAYLTPYITEVIPKKIRYLAQRRMVEKAVIETRLVGIFDAHVL